MLSFNAIDLGERSWRKKISWHLPGWFKTVCEFVNRKLVVDVIFIYDCSNKKVPWLLAGK